MGPVSNPHPVPIIAQVLTDLAKRLDRNADGCFAIAELTPESHAKYADLAEARTLRAIARELSKIVQELK
jgi:hypothetical protein